MEEPTYTLITSGTTAGSYYQDVRGFAYEVENEAQRRIWSIVASFMDHESQNGHTVATPLEHSLELLTFGVFWQVYGVQAQRTNWFVCLLLQGLAQWRMRGGKCKAFADRYRATMLTRTLDLCRKRTKFMNMSVQNQVIPSINDLRHLLRWLAATGEFKQETAHLEHWVRFLSDQTPERFALYLAEIQRFTVWFAERSMRILGPYTVGVDAFLQGEYLARQEREDVVFCGRSRLEYHLNMVGAEVMNRAFRAAFEGCKQQQVLLPGCMCARPDGECQAISEPLGMRCTSCTRRCRVQQLTQLGEMQGFSVYIASHESEVLPQPVAQQLQQDAVGVVGVACALNLIAGGWKLQANNIPAQCVLLNCSGCSRHWRRHRYPTDIDQGELLRVLGLGSSCSAEAGRLRSAAR